MGGAKLKEEKNIDKLMNMLVLGETEKSDKSK